jgi:hypothetical protein
LRWFARVTAIPFVRRLVVAKMLRDAGFDRMPNLDAP